VPATDDKAPTKPLESETPKDPRTPSTTKADVHQAPEDLNAVWTAGTDGAGTEETRV
jgi:hypothetical protein